MAEAIDTKHADTDISGLNLADVKGKISNEDYERLVKHKP
jgi:hypothetical protein